MGRREFCALPLALLTACKDMWAGGRQAAGYTAPPAGGGGGSGFTPNAGVAYSGAFADGQTMTVNLPAGGLGARANPLPRYYYPFGEDGSTNLSTHPTLSRLSKTLTSPVGNNTFIQSAIKPVNAQGACQYIPVTAGGGSHAPSAFAQNVYDTPGGAGNWTYLFMKRYWAFSGAPGNVKVWRLWNSTIAWSVMFLGNSANNEWGMGSDTANGIASGIVHPNFFNAGNFAWPAINQWNTDEWLWQENTFNTSDGIHQWARQAQMAYEMAGRFNVVGGGSNGTTSLVTGYLDEFTLQNNSIPNGTTDIGYYGALVCDDSILQLIATDEGATYKTGYCYSEGLAQKNREIQIQTARSDTSITFVVRRGSHASLTGKHLLAVTGYGTAIDLGVGA